MGYSLTDNEPLHYDDIPELVEGLPDEFQHLLPEINSVVETEDGEKRVVRSKLVNTMELLDLFADRPHLPDDPNLFLKHIHNAPLVCMAIETK